MARAKHSQEQITATARIREADRDVYDWPTDEVEEEVDLATADPLRGWRKKFLAAYAEFGVIREACRQARVGRGTVRRTLDKEPRFRELFSWAEDDAIDKIELVAIKKAIAGNEKLLQFILSAKKPKPYGNKTQLEAVINQTVDLETTERVEYAPDQLAEILNVLSQSGALNDAGSGGTVEEGSDPKTH